MDIQAFINNATEIFDAIFTRHNFEKAEEIRDYIKACVDLTMEIFESVLDRDDVSIPQSRSIQKSILKEDFEKELEKRMAIIPFSFDKEE